MGVKDFYRDLSGGWLEYIHTNQEDLVVMPIQRRFTGRWVLVLCVIEENGNGTVDITPVAELISDELRLRKAQYRRPQ